MAFSFQEYLMSLPGAGRVQVQRNPADRPSYYDDMRFLNKAGGYTGIGLQATLPVVMNNLQYAEPWIDTANAYIDYSRALGGVNNYLTGTEFLGRNGAMYFDQTLRPGTQLGLATNMALGQISPYVNIARGLGGLTSNDANPYGAIPVIREFNQGLDKVVTGMNQSPFGQYMGRMGGSIYDNTIGRLYGMDNGFFRGVGNLASIPGEVINTGGNVMSGLGGLIREGYQALDRNVFNNVLPGGSDITDEESMQFDNPFEENPAEGLVDVVTDIGDSFKNKSTLEYEGFDDANRAIIDRYVEKGIPMEDALAIMDAERVQIANSGEGYANPADAIRNAEIEYTPEQIEYYSGLMQQAMADPAGNPFLNEDLNIDEPYVPPITPEDQAIIDQSVDALEEQAGDLADVVIDPTPDGDVTIDPTPDEPLTEEELFDMNSLSDKVLDMLEDDMYSELSIDEMQKFADMMEYETPEGMLNLTDQEKLSIAEQYAFDEGQYQEHLNELEQADIDATNKFNQQDYIESVSGLHGLNRQMEYVAGQIDNLLTSDEITDEKISMATKYLQDLRAFEDKELFQGLTSNTNQDFIDKYQEKIDTYKSDIRTKIDEVNTQFANAYKTQYETKTEELRTELKAIANDYKKRKFGREYYTSEQKSRADEIVAELAQLKIDAEVYTNVNDYVDNLYDEMTTDIGQVRSDIIESIGDAYEISEKTLKNINRMPDVNDLGHRVYTPEEIAYNSDVIPSTSMNNLSQTISAEDIIRTMDNMTPVQIENYRPAQIRVNDYISTYNPATDQYSIDYDMIGNTSVSSGVDLRNASILANASAQQESARQAEEAMKQAEQARQAEEALKKAEQQRIANDVAVQNAQRASQQAMDTINRIQLVNNNLSTSVAPTGGSTMFHNYSMFSRCWVAREVYGADNPKWLKFRDWIDNEAPSNVRESYLEHGASLAEYISDKPNLKNKIRIFMDSKIGE